MLRRFSRWRLHCHRTVGALQIHKILTGFFDFLSASANTKPTKEIPSTAIYGLNQFSDLSVEEFRQRYLTLKAPKYRATRHHIVTPKKMRCGTLKQGSLLRDAL